MVLKFSLEEEEKAAADQLHLQALLDVAVEQRQQLRDVRERQHQQRNLQLTGDHNAHRGKEKIPQAVNMHRALQMVNDFMGEI